MKANPSQFSFNSYYLLDLEDDHTMTKVIRHIELIDDEALEYGIKVVKCKDKLMAKKFGFRQPPGLTYFRKGKFINYDGLCNLSTSLPGFMILQ